jgi:hypothetical protein
METIMAILRYCWRCQMSLPTLDETEWETIANNAESPTEPLKLNTVQNVEMA